LEVRKQDKEEKLLVIEWGQRQYKYEKVESWSLRKETRHVSTKVRGIVSQNAKVLLILIRTAPASLLEYGIRP